MIFALLGRRFRAWLLAAIIAPVVGGVLKRVGQRLQARRSTSRVGGGLVKVADLLTAKPARDEAAAGRRRRRRRR